MRRDEIVAAARSWLGTPYRHQASRKGAGCDCLGLVRGVWRELVGPEPARLPPYTPDWAEALGQETLLHAARRHLREVPVGEARDGDVLVFRDRVDFVQGQTAQTDAVLQGDHGRSSRMVAQD